MAFIHIISFVMIALTAGYLLKVSLSDMLPFVWCGIIGVLYVLAFARGLSLIDIIAPALAVAGILYICVIKKNTEGFFLYAKKEFTSAQIWIYILLGFVIFFGVSKKIVTWWDDVNFWASDVKSLYFQNGFPIKYANVSPEFGDYPPGGQLAKWYVLHMDADRFREELAFVGYYLFNFSFMIPLYKKIEGKNKWLVLPLTLITWMFPGMAEKYGYAGFCADLSMAFLFGSILIAAFDKREEAVKYDYLRVALFASVLVICKSTGAIWTFFGLAIFCLVRIIDSDNKKREVIKSVLLCLLPLLTGASWMAFCLIRHRVTKTTTTAITYITTDKYGISEYTPDFIKSFAKGFVLEPLHVDRVWIAPSALVMLVCLTVIVFLFDKKNMLPRKSGRFISIALPVVGVIYYVIIFISHITIFAMETQYLESMAMAASIERYGAPYMVGSLMLISWIWLNRGSDEKIGMKYIVFIVMVVLLTNIPAAYDGLLGYRAHLAEDKQIREAFVDEEAYAFLNTIKEKIGDGNTRVCRVHDGGYYRVADTYIGYEASPVSVMSISYDFDSIDENTFIYAVNQTHAKFLYADEQDVSVQYLDNMADSGEFKTRTLYFISYEDGGMKLYEQ